jgi:ABC-type multidrug transport system fused ATPase/permease subunit
MEMEMDSDKQDVVLCLSQADCYWNYVREMSPSALMRGSTTFDEGVFEVEHGASAKSKNDQDTDSVTSSDLIPALSDISLDFKRGELTCVIGPVGCGKSALLQALVGELPVYRGRLKRYFHGEEGDNIQMKIAYSSQDPWIMDGTVRENITMGQPFDERWYNEVIDACGLRLDLEIFRNGDQTVVGDRGIQCSGGQRARIGLARAVYRDADVLIADDPLSAVDAKVGRQIFQEALQGLSVNRGKCVVLATHQHQYVHDHRCVLLANGHIECIGSYSDCVDAAGGKLSAHVADDAVDSLDFHIADLKTTKGENELTMNSDSNVIQERNGELAKLEIENADQEDNAVDDSKEDKITGEVKWSTYLNYIRAMGGFWVASAMLVVFCATQGIVLWTVATMGRWAQLPSSGQSSWDILGLVIGQGCLVLFLAVFRAVLSFGLTINASKKLHDKMAKALLRAPISFFDTNP